MEIKYCKNKKCQRPLPEGYNYKYCENCRNEHVKAVKNAGKAVASFTALVAIRIATKGRINLKK